MTDRLKVFSDLELLAVIEDSLMARVSDNPSTLVFGDGEDFVYVIQAGGSHYAISIQPANLIV